MSVSVALSLDGLTSVEPAPGVTVAVLTSEPVAPGSMVPLTVSVSALPSPAARLALVKLMLLPDEPLMPQAPVPVTAHRTVTPVMDGGTTSVMLKPLAAEGPALVTVSV